MLQVGDCGAGPQEKYLVTVLIQALSSFRRLPFGLALMSLYSSQKTLTCPQLLRLYKVSRLLLGKERTL